MELKPQFLSTTGSAKRYALGTLKGVVLVDTSKEKKSIQHLFRVVRTVNTIVIHQV